MQTEKATFGAGCFWGHAEVVQVEFDPSQVSYDEILDVFWSNHNPTTLNRQGPDVGTQYRSVIFYHTPEQKRVAEEVIAQLEEAGVWDDPIVTEVTPASAFYAAEDYHQEYFRRNGGSTPDGSPEQHRRH